MAPMKPMTLRLNLVQRQLLEQLADKLQIDPTNVIRFAIARLAEEEGITPQKRREPS